MLLDVTQAVAHLPLDDGSRRAEFLVLSAHKAYGPMGVGAGSVTCVRFPRGMAFSAGP